MFTIRQAFGFLRGSLVSAGKYLSQRRISRIARRIRQQHSQHDEMVRFRLTRAIKSAYRQ